MFSRTMYYWWNINPTFVIPLEMSEYHNLTNDLMVGYLIYDTISEIFVMGNLDLMMLGHHVVGIGSHVTCRIAHAVCRTCICIIAWSVSCSCNAMRRASPLPPPLPAWRAGSGGDAHSKRSAGKVLPAKKGVDITLYRSRCEFCFVILTSGAISGIPALPARLGASAPAEWLLRGASSGQGPIGLWHSAVWRHALSPRYGIHLTDALASVEPVRAPTGYAVER